MNWKQRINDQNFWYTVAIVLAMTCLLIMSVLIFRQNIDVRDSTQVIEDKSDQDLCITVLNNSVSHAIAVTVNGLVTDNQTLIASGQVQLDTAINRAERVRELCPLGGPATPAD